MKIHTPEAQNAKCPGSYKGQAVPRFIMSGIPKRSNMQKFTGKSLK
jgi:hypothetical protein